MEKKKTVFHKKWFRRGMILFFSVIAAGILLVAGTNLYMISSVKGRILTAEEAAGLDADCILVLGCGVSESGMPSPVLSDRLNRGIDLYEAGASQKLLMSGDHGRTNYDEVNAMKNYAIDRGIPSENVFMDHAGFSTYESMYRARDIFRGGKDLYCFPGIPSGTFCLSGEGARFGRLWRSGGRPRLLWQVEDGRSGGAGAVKGLFQRSNPA